jgi:hypothetical protein
MTKPLSFREFYQKWLAEFESLRGSAGPLHDRFWEGSMAYAELVKPIYWIVLLVPDSDPSDYPFIGLFELIWREIEVYWRLSGKIVSRNDEFRTVKSLFAGMEKELNEIDSTLQIPELANLLRTLRFQVQKAITDLEDLKNVSFANSMRQYKTADSDGNETWVKPDKTDPLLPYPPIDVEMREQVFGNDFDFDSPTTNREFDTIAQVRLAHVFRQTLPSVNVSLMTIARLVVLTYICAGLAHEQTVAIKGSRAPSSLQPALVILSTGAVLTVDAVYQKLRDAGIR